MGRYVRRITLKEMIDKDSIQSLTQTNITGVHMSNLKVTSEMIERHKDRKERETGVFHWKDEDGNFLPINKVSVEVLREAAVLCQQKQCQLHEQMCGWQYRLDKVEEELESRGQEVPDYQPKRRKKRPQFKAKDINNVDIVEDAEETVEHSNVTA